jgi:hypothetical protein
MKLIAKHIKTGAVVEFPLDTSIAHAKAYNPHLMGFEYVI